MRPGYSKIHYGRIHENINYVSVHNYKYSNSVVCHYWNDIESLLGSHELVGVFKIKWKL